MHQMVPTIYYFFWVRYHPSKIYSQKKSRQETQYRPLFPPTTKPRPLNPLDHGPTSLVLAGYRLAVLRSSCACSTVFCVCLPRCFCYSRLVLFRFVVSLSYFFMSFLCLSFSLIWLFFLSRNSYCWHFLLFLISFHRASSYQFSRLSFYTKEFGPLWAR